MSDYHDPIRHGTTISEVYSEDKRPLGLFLTAGCPFAVKLKNNGNEPLLPDIAGLTAEVEAKIEGELKDKLVRAIETIKLDGTPNPNIEHLLTYIRSLKQVVGAGDVRGFTAADLESLDEAVSAAIVDIVNVTLPDETTPFDSVANWIGSANRSIAVELFTTNYDLLIEQALERNRIPYFDGFVGTDKPFFDHRAIDDDKLPSRWARLWKLHGSINWQIDTDGKPFRSFSGADKCPIIHPSHLKYSESRRMPYLAMMDKMRAFLRQQSSVLLISGYSFSDDHVNEVLLQGAQFNPTCAIFALQYGSLNNYDPAIKLASAARNINVLGEDAAIIGGDRAPWKTREAAMTNSYFTSFWSADAPAGDDLVSGKFLLGDFVRLGVFLSALSSHTVA